ncbi:MAG: imidazole glycerol phosphate synthase subunit HisH [Treponema sp.]|nr:imidazole glycerol phosphate synthase subunit HisH [Treponema sp.]
MTGIVDYNAGNIKSVERALASLGAAYVLSKNPRDLEACDRLIFPGVGEAKYAMEQLKATGFDSFLREWAAAGKPLLGICLGSQIIFEHSEEGDVDCLGLLKGEIRHFSSVWAGMEKCAETAPAATSATVAPSATAASPRTTIGLKVPHIGWNDISCTNGGSRLLAGVPEHSDVYFVHSYLIQPADWSIVKATADYGCPVPACVESGSITAFQFHPEKSGKCGLKMLENFISSK